MKESFDANIVKKLVLKTVFLGALLFLMILSLYTAVFSLPLGVSIMVAAIITVAIYSLFKVFILADMELIQSKIKKLKQIYENYENVKLSTMGNVELSKANEKLEELDERKSNFVSVVAHQLRTPISAVKWTLNMIMNGELGPITEEQKSFLQKSYDSNDRMIKLVNNMLDVDRIQAGKQRFDPQKTNIIDLLNNVLFDLSPQAKKRNVTIEFIGKVEAVPQVYVDQASMRGVFQNLLENAIKYTIDNGRIEIDLKIEDGHILISVRDSGIGIPKNQEKNVFGKFFRSQNAIKQETDGIGLGLFITKSIVEQHGGKIWFESNEGKGTIFYFTIPFGKK